MDFKIVSDYLPQGDQPQAIEKLVRGINEGRTHQVLLGVTGSGKTFTMASVIERVQRPVLVMAHNKTLAAQLYQEFKSFFPHNAIEYFVSYYDYYQPEAYIPSTDTYIEKESTVNEDIDRLRLSATRTLFERRDCIIVASVSCIYGLGDPDAYYGMVAFVERGEQLSRTALLKKLVEIQYQRNDTSFERGMFRVRGDVVEIYPVYQENALRIEFWGDEIESLSTIDPLLGEVIETHQRLPIYPKSHFVMPQDRLKRAIRMLKELGYCHGIENYSRHLTGRSPGEPPPTLLDYLARDAIVMVDESHQTVPQVRGMYHGDQSRKKTLVEYGFRLPSAMDNRPLNFEEWEERMGQLVFVSATPGPYELSKTAGEFVEQVIRPTGLIDPVVDVRPVKGQIDDLLNEVRMRAAKNERVLVTTLTKKMAENLTEYYAELGVRVRYLHSEIQTLDRIKILRDLRAGEFDVLVGINLLREGLDLPEVSLVAILDADKEGFLRSEQSLIQTIGRAARNLNGQAILYADRMTDSMKRALGETQRRRERQAIYNRENNITPASIVKAVGSTLVSIVEMDYFKLPSVAEEAEEYSAENIAATIQKLERQMRSAAAHYEFERAAELRDKIKYLRTR